MPRDDDPSPGPTVLIELEVVGEKFRRVLVLEMVEVWLDWSRRS